jgi:sporulation protein YlmC with PRC-barrel domain
VGICGLLMLINGMVKDFIKKIKKRKISPFFLEGISTMTYKKEKKDFDLDFVNVKE